MGQIISGVTTTGPAATTMGIDLGTGSVKVALVDDVSSVTSMASRTYRVHAPEPGWAESDPAEWLACTQSAAAEALASAENAPTAVGFSGQMHGVVIVDENLDPLRPAILWADTRSAAQALQMGTDLGASTLARLGSAPVSGFAATTIAWLHENEPSVMRRATYVLQPKDWLRARLGGGIATDPSDASGTLMFDVTTGSWSSDVRQWLSLADDAIPPVLSSTAEIGAVRVGEVSIPAVVGGADTACALAGLGVDGGFIAVGSGSQVVRVLGEPVLDETLRTHTFATAGDIGAGWYRIGAVQSAGLTLTAALAWFGASIDEANAALGEGVRSSDPIFVPYLSGERTPFMDPSLRASWIGLSLATDRAAMLRSVLEGVAQAVALGVEAVQASGLRLPDVVPLVGGGTHALTFRQLLADTSGSALAVAEAPHAAVVGAALLARGLTRSQAPATLGSVVEPDPARRQMLAERRERMVLHAMKID